MQAWFGFLGGQITDFSESRKEALLAELDPAGWLFAVELMCLYCFCVPIQIINRYAFSKLTD